MTGCTLLHKFLSNSTDIVPVAMESESTRYLSDQSNPNSSPLLRLPRSYETVFTRPSARMEGKYPILTKGKGSLNPFTPHDNLLETNLLKYVCRQLHREAPGFGLKLYEITVPHNERPGTTSETCARFLDDCSPLVKDNIRKITICEGTKQPGEQGGRRHVYFSLNGMAQLCELCISRPRIEITEPVENFNMCLYCAFWITEGSAMQMAVRKHLLRLQTAMVGWVREMVDSMAGQWEGFALMRPLCRRICGSSLRTNFMRRG
ncbi:hypothetical protein K469DRAFT_758445 [Zopfia rhizophila CBS 207.26]|uniref:Uncharacterized protein n=1 Tax=Zopfia rhizophila CBS 207.26 TaxID=1314779 RepID=A0A6A6EU70_9PEZI|nr:hypothetical protein K469DRAFT_758445 [Zopfia rhizophila CBS 207.26]